MKLLNELNSLEATSEKTAIFLEYLPLKTAVVG